MVRPVHLPQPAQAAVDLAAARRVLSLEAEGIAALSATIDERFAIACDILAAVKGRVIVTGMGKSGHVARKIAATMASTGTPAQYVHPAEASHGDLGMIRHEDAVLAMSNSGETAELGDLLEYTRRFDIPLIAITSNPGSTLGRIADVCLALPQVPEATSSVLAPTTSTTMNLALGDALAVALLERKGFTVEDFHTYHPGGKLGRRLLKVADLMHREGELPLGQPTDRMSEIVLAMTEKRFGVIGIVDGEQGPLVGVITDGDLRRHMSAGLLDLKAEDVMTHKPISTQADALAAEVLGLMNARQISALFVLADGRPVGIVHIHDLLRAGVA